MAADNSIYCQKCRSIQTFKMATKIKKFPEVLIIILNRGVGLEFDVKISFEKMINLKKFTESSEDKKEENSEDVTQYDLIGVISLLGESVKQGHFIAYCRDPIKREKWFKYNDSFVDEVKDFTKEIIDFGMPYVLFYQIKKNEYIKNIQNNFMQGELNKISENQDNNHENNQKILPSIKFIDENKEGKKSKRKEKKSKKNFMDLNDYITTTNIKSEQKIEDPEKVDGEVINKDEEKSNKEKPFEGKILKKNPNEKILSSETIRPTDEQETGDKLYEEKPTEEKSSEKKSKAEEPKEEKESERKRKRGKRTSLKGDKIQEESQKVEEIISKEEEISSKEKLSGEDNIKKEDKEKESNNKNANLIIIKEENKINENSEIENNIHNLNNKNLENEIYKLLNEQKKLNDKIKDLENKLKEKNNLINDFIETINKLQNLLNDNIHQNSILNENLMRKDKEIEELKKEMEQLKLKLSKFPLELSEKEELVSIVITTIDENINANYLCKNTDKFIKIEKEFYNKYPEYKNLDNYFTINGNKINPDLSLDENKIKNNDIVVFNQ